MKRFIPDIPGQDETISPEDDYRNAKKFSNLSVGDHYLFYRWMLVGIRYIPIKSIAKCFTEIEACTARACCGSVSLDMQSLVIRTHDGWQKQLFLDDDESVFSHVDKPLLSYLLQELKRKNSDIEFVYFPIKTEAQKPGVAV
jgi:hypothetical protein